MSSTKVQTLKGFRDFLPKEAKKRQYVIDTLRQVFESYGFEPLETPALEYEEVLLGKYGEEGDKLIYRFTDRGGRKVALRYDQTVPLARVVAQYGNPSAGGLPMPFKRYQIQPVWRAENPQKGRFREFLQCDVDIIGTDSPLADAEVITVATKSLEQLGCNAFQVLINDRSVFSNTPKEAIPIVDKLKKIGREGVISQLVTKKIAKTPQDASSILLSIEEMNKTERLDAIFSCLQTLGLKKNQYEFSPTLARGLDYYTSTIFEIEIEGYGAGSVCGGGRYDRLIGMFAGKDIPAVGFAFGFDRLIEAMDELNLFPENILASTIRVLITVFSKELQEESLTVCSYLRANSIPTEIFLDKDISLEKQLKYADQKSIPYTIIIGPKEAAKNTVILRNMKTREQQEIPEDNLPDALRS